MISRSISLFFAILVLCQCSHNTPTVAVGGMGGGTIFPDDWTNSAKLTIDNTKVPSTQTDFPVMVTEANLPSTLLDLDGANAAKSDGGDIRFSSDAAGTTQLAFDIEYIALNNNPNLSKLTVYVKIPSISGTVDTDFYIWWGNASASVPLRTDTYGAEAVWSNGFVGALDLSESRATTADNYKDMSNSINHGTLVDGNGNSTQIDGIASKALDLNGDADYLRIDDAASLDFSGDFTITFFLKTTQTAADEIIEKQSGQTYYQSLLGQSGGSGFSFEINDGSTKTTLYSSGATINNGVWHMITLVRDYGSQLLCYVDGQFNNSKTDLSGSITNNSQPLTFAAGGGSDNVKDRFAAASIDEIRISNVLRTSDWIQTTYNNISSPETFVSSNARTLTLSVSGSGAVYTNPDGDLTQIKQENDVVTLYAVPADGAEFTSWSGDLVSTNNPETVTMTASKNITANFTGSNIIFPGASWATDTPANQGMDSAQLSSYSSGIGGSGIVIRNGYQVYSWGTLNADDYFASAAKPVMTTMLFFAMKEGLISSPDEKINKTTDWALSGVDTNITWTHLANMTSGYGLDDAPGTKWAYNDYAVQFYVKSLFDKVFVDTPQNATANSSRLGYLSIEDIDFWGGTCGRGIYALCMSIRDAARIGWFWLNKGNWNGRQLLPKWYFDKYMNVHVPASMPRTTDTTVNDYLAIGTYGGGADQTAHGPGSYGFAWWHNNNRDTFSTATRTHFQANGRWDEMFIGVFPALNMVVVHIEPHVIFNNPATFPADFEPHLQKLIDAVTGFTEPNPAYILD